MPTDIVMSGREREEKPPHLPTPRMAALESSRQKKVSPIKKMTGADKTRLLHGTGQS